MRRLFLEAADRRREGGEGGGGGVGDEKGRREG